MTGPVAKANPLRFSTKYQDDETDLLYYGYRYYSASTGRWLSRDPIGAEGGLNLYCFTAGDPISGRDSLGLFRDDWMTACRCTCISGAVTYPPGLSWYYSPDDLGRRFGVPITVKWNVRGNPSKCRYYQDERGSRITVWGINPKRDPTIRDVGEFRWYSPGYMDPMGIGPFWPNQFTGTYGIKIHWVATFRCVSEDGSEISIPEGFDKDREGTFTVPPEGTMGRK